MSGHRRHGKVPTHPRLSRHGASTTHRPAVAERAQVLDDAPALTGATRDGVAVVPDARTGPTDRPSAAEDAAGRPRRARGPTVRPRRTRQGADTPVTEPPPDDWSAGRPTPNARRFSCDVPTVMGATRDRRAGRTRRPRPAHGPTVRPRRTRQGADTPVTEPPPDDWSAGRPTPNARRFSCDVPTVMGATRDRRAGRTRRPRRARVRRGRPVSLVPVPGPARVPPVGRPGRPVPVGRGRPGRRRRRNAPGSGRG